MISDIETGEHGASPGGRACSHIRQKGTHLLEHVSQESLIYSHGISPK